MNVINESSFIRLWKHIKEPNRSFGVVTAYKRQDAEYENFQNHLDLGKEIRNLGYGFIEHKFGYSYQDPKTRESGIADEMSYFIPNITLEKTLYLGRLFNQETIIHKDNKTFALYFCDSRGICLTFKKDDKVFSLSPHDIENAYSQLIKANRNQRVKFSYIAELRIPSLAEVLLNKKRNEIAMSRWVAIMER